MSTSVGPFWPSDHYLRKKCKPTSPPLIEAIDGKAFPSICLRINLNRSHTKIKDEFSRLLTVVGKELRKHNIKPIKMNAREFALYREVYTLRKKNAWTFQQIAQKVFPRDFINTKQGLKKESAIKKAQQIYREAKKLKEGKTFSL
jgi:hypothetical protein